MVDRVAHASCSGRWNSIQALASGPVAKLLLGARKNRLEAYSKLLSVVVTVYSWTCRQVIFRHHEARATPQSIELFVVPLGTYNLKFAGSILQPLSSCTPDLLPPPPRFSTVPKKILGSGVRNPLPSAKVILASQIVRATKEKGVDFYCLTDRSQYSRPF